MQLAVMLVELLDGEETVRVIRFSGNNFIIFLWPPDYKDCMLQRQQLDI